MTIILVLTAILVLSGSVVFIGSLASLCSSDSKINEVNEDIDLKLARTQVDAGHSAIY